MALRNMDVGRTFTSDQQGHINPAPRVPKPRIISKQEWGGGESSGTMRSHFPVRLTFHHEGSPRPLTPDRDPKELMRALQKYGWREKNWPDIPYHFLIDLDGNIYEARDPMKVGDTNTTYDPSGHLLISVMGNYARQAANEKQLMAIADLMAWASDYYNIDPSSLRGHQEYAETDCPGRYLYPFVVSGFFEGEIRKRLQKAYLGRGMDEEGNTKASITPGTAATSTTPAANK